MFTQTHSQVGFQGLPKGALPRSLKGTGPGPPTPKVGRVRERNQTGAEEGIRSVRLVTAFTIGCFYLSKSHS